MTDEIKIPEDWTRHDGGKCPVDPNAIVMVLLREGTITVPQEAGFFSDGFYDWWEWRGDRDRNIIAYRLAGARQ